MVNWGSVGTDPEFPTYYSDFSLPDNQNTAQVWEFNGSNQWMTTQNNAGFTQFYMNLWFYPTDSGRILMTIQDTQTGDGVSYHHTALEINSNLTVSGKFWANSYLTTGNTVTLNSWNHIYFRHNGSQTLLQLNGGTAVTANNSWSYPASLVLGFGTTSVTNNGISARYQGRISYFEMNSSNMASNFDSTRARFESPPIFINDDFTIEWWQKAESNGQNSRPWAIGLLGSTSGQVISVSYEGVGRDYFWMNNGYFNDIAYRPVKNHYGIGWEHMAIVRNSGELEAYSNGEKYVDILYANQAITATNADLTIGTGELAAGNYRGYIKDLHIIKGYAKYTNTFTPPSNPLISQTGTVFLMSVMNSATAFDDVVGLKVPTVVNSPSYSDEDPWSFPTQTFTAFAYGDRIIAENTPPAIVGQQIGLKVSDSSGWFSYVRATDISSHVQVWDSVPSRPPGEIYTMEQDSTPLVISTSTYGPNESNYVIDYEAVDSLGEPLKVKEGWTVTFNTGTGTVIANAFVVTGTTVRITVDVDTGTGDEKSFTFTSPEYGGSIYFDTNDYLNYGPSVDFAFDLEDIETNGLSLNIDANNVNSYPGAGGGFWYDLTPNTANITLYNSPYYVAGSQSYLEFNGVNQYGTGAVTSILPASAYSKMVWFMINNFSADNNLVSSDGGGHFLYFNQTNTLYAGHSNVVPYNGFGSTQTFSTNTWYCATITYSNVNGIKMYINGQLENSNPSFAQHTGNGSVNVACFGAGGNLLNGRIGRVLCYNVELTSQEVLNNFNATRNRYGI